MVDKKMKKPELLMEHLTFNEAKLNLIETKDETGNAKHYIMEGIFIQGDVKNHNGRIYPKEEIAEAVKSINSRLESGVSILGEVDHPSNLQINLDRVSHVITEMRMDGANGVGKLKVIPTPSGILIHTLLQNGVKLGVSSRGTGEVDHYGRVKGFDIVTVDIVAQPSAPDAYPQAILEALERYKRKNVLIDLATSSEYDPRAQRYLKSEITKWLNNNLKIR